MIEEVILNLITNAAEAMKGIEVDKKIEVTSFMRNKHILVKVSDSGPGVRSDLKGKIFDPFYTTKAANTGIGLSLSHRVVTDHGGALSVGTSKWGGAEFIIEIPLEKETA
ncbi:MAG: GHKL domain-containing protein [Deltaproteobacteria bacterium]|nr:GHKL domain-containing protein [Deltaproteobacteria bacterium]